MQKFSKMVAAAANRSVSYPFVANLPAVPNFRLLCAGLEPHRRSCAIFRSARPDFIGREDLNKFKELGIQCIIDFRSQDEYRATGGSNLLDEKYRLCTVKLPKNRNYKHDELVEFEYVTDLGVDDSGLRHYFIDFFSLSYFLEVFKRAPWYICLYSLLILLYDTIFQTDRKYFVRLFARWLLNLNGLIGQYQDMIDYSQRSICAALKLLSVTSNLPALLNCAHGKDRTGIVSALLLHCLGKTPDYIAAEYALSNEGLAPLRKQIHSEMVERFHLSEDFICARAETIKQLFSYIESRYGSVQDYLEYIGFGSNEQEMLRRNFLDGAKNTDCSWFDTSVDSNHGNVPLDS